MKKNITKPSEVRDEFEKFVYVGLDGCHYWTGTTTNKGYGTLWYQGTFRFAHRFSYQIYKGEIPEGLLVCHSCDNPLCVNTDHLFLGTFKDNMRDMVKKGRNSNGKKELLSCKNGHEYSYKNTKILVNKKTGRSYRRCRTCERGKDLRYRNKKKLNEKV